MAQMMDSQLQQQLQNLQQQNQLTAALNFLRQHHAATGGVTGMVPTTSHVPPPIPSPLQQQQHHHQLATTVAGGIPGVRTTPQPPQAAIAMSTNDLIYQTLMASMGMGGKPPR